MDDGTQIEGLIYIMKMIQQLPTSDCYYYGIQDAYRDLGLTAQIKTILEPALKRSLNRRKPE